MNEQDFRVSPPGPVPLPTPEHQRKITRNKWFEVITVCTMIIAGFGYLAWRNSGRLTSVDPARTLGDAVKAVEATVEPRGGSKFGQGGGLFGRRMVSFSYPMDLFECRVDLIGKDENSPLETAIIRLAPRGGEWDPSDAALLDAVNSVGELGQKLVRSTGEAMDKAANTMELVGDSARPHDKGVAATNDGWKVTYVTYRSFDEKADPPQPVLYYVIQRMSAGEDESIGELNRTLYEAIRQGADAKAAILRAASQYTSAG
ncbi:MAG: hypothetical protein HUU46_01845 [Candidatus Hydrogenedentes bacterium]|nr:hypothetical protein [Candidatus Hydrogenedentota bacterium]